MKCHRTSLLALAAFVPLGCGALESTDFDPEPARSLPEAPGTVYDIDPDHTHVVFKVGHLGISDQYGRIGDVAGAFLVADEPTASWVWIAMDAASVDTNVPARDQHVRSADFFDVKQYPEIRFRSTSVEPAGQESYTITGDLDFHGVTRSLSFEMRRTGSGSFEEYGERSAFQGSFVLDRFAHGIETYPDVVGREIELMLTVEGVKR